MTGAVTDRINNKQPFHAYIFGTSFWYGLRGFARLTDPVRVSTWFRPPAQPVLQPSGMYQLPLIASPSVYRNYIPAKDGRISNIPSTQLSTSKLVL